MADPTCAGIYCIRNLVNGRVYVGSSVKISNRWKGHRHLLRRGKHPSVILQKAWKLRGEESFSFEVLEVVSELAQLIEREQSWIEQLCAVDRIKGYNTRPHAKNQLGLKFSAEARAKMSASAKGKKKPFSDEHRAFLRAAAIARNKSPAHIEKMSATKKGKPLPVRTRFRMSAAHLKRLESDLLTPI